MPPKFSPPADWRRLYTRLEEYRQNLEAPVDTVGCHCLKDENAPPETQRFHTLVALMLSSQTKDAVTAAAMGELLKVGLTPQSVAEMPATTFQGYISKVGFHPTKTKHIKQVADILLKDYGGMVPREYEQIISLPGVGPKMAHLFVQAADGRVLGIGVDTHVHRISQRFRWVPPTVKGPEDTRKVLESWLPKDKWPTINHLLVGLGQTICSPVGPKCGECQLNDICPNAFKEQSKSAASRAGAKRGRDAGTPRASSITVPDIEDLKDNKKRSPKRAKTTPSKKK